MRIVRTVLLSLPLLLSISGCALNPEGDNARLAVGDGGSPEYPPPDLGTDDMCGDGGCITCGGEVIDAGSASTSSGNISLPFAPPPGPTDCKKEFWERIYYKWCFGSTWDATTERYKGYTACTKTADCAGKGGTCDITAGCCIDTAKIPQLYSKAPPPDAEKKTPMCSYTAIPKGTCKDCKDMLKDGRLIVKDKETWRYSWFAEKCDLTAANFDDTMCTCHNASKAAPVCVFKNTTTKENCSLVHTGGLKGPYEGNNTVCSDTKPIAGCSQKQDGWTFVGERDSDSTYKK